MKDQLTAEEKEDIRNRLTLFAGKLVGIPYVFGAEWKDFSVAPEALDCSELVEGVYGHFGLQMPDGSQNQFDFTISAATPKMGDLAFFGRGGKTGQIYHVGIVYDETNIIEARGFDASASFRTGEVILRSRDRWEKYANFCGYRSHPKLA